MQDENIKAPRQVERRTILKGAAWSAPVIAAAVAAPMAAASDKDARLAIGSGCIQVAGVSLFPGFSVHNTGTDAYSGTITVVETIDLSAIKLDPTLSGFKNDGLLSSAARDALWLVLLVQGIASGSSAGVSTTNWAVSTQGPTIPIFGGRYAPMAYSRTVTISAPIAPGNKANWGNLLDVTQLLNALNAVGLTTQIISRSATITSPTGNPPVVDAGPRELDFQLLGTCKP